MNPQKRPDATTSRRHHSTREQTTKRKTPDPPSSTRHRQDYQIPRSTPRYPDRPPIATKEPHLHRLPEAARSVFVVIASHHPTTSMPVQLFELAKKPEWEDTSEIHHRDHASAYRSKYQARPPHAVRDSHRRVSSTSTTTHAHQNPKLRNIAAKIPAPPREKTKRKNGP